MPASAWATRESPVGSPSWRSASWDLALVSAEQARATLRRHCDRTPAMARTKSNCRDISGLTLEPPCRSCPEGISPRRAGVRWCAPRSQRWVPPAGAGRPGGSDELGSARASCSAGSATRSATARARSRACSGSAVRRRFQRRRWPRLALDAGYTDQARMTAGVSGLAGMSPVRFLKDHTDRA